MAKKYYQSQSKGMKNIKKRLRILHQKVCELQHYYKIRCKKRNTLSTKYKLIAYHLNRQKRIEKAISKIANRTFILNIKTTAKDPTNNKKYYLMLSRIHITRLEQMLNRKGKVRA